MSALGLLAMAAVVAACASSLHNYLDPDRPLYQGSYGVAPSPRHEIRVVTYSKGLAERLASFGFAWPTSETGKTWKIFAFDHILARGLGDLSGARSGVAREVKGVSDHYPLWLTFPVTGRASGFRTGLLLRRPQKPVSARSESGC